MKNKWVINLIVFTLIILNVGIFLLIFKNKTTGTGTSKLSKSTADDVPAAYKKPPAKGEKSVADPGEYDGTGSLIPFDITQVIRKGETGESRGIAYQIDSLRFSKEPPFPELTGSTTEEIERDESLNILNEYSYVSVVLTIKNTLAEPNVMYLNTLALIGVDENNGKVQDLLFHCGQIEGYLKIPQMKANVNDRSYYRIDLDPKDTQDFECLYIQKEEEINNLKLYLWVCPAGAGTAGLNYYHADNLFLEL